MSMPAILFAFADDRRQSGRKLRQLGKESKQVLGSLDTPATSHLWDILPIHDVTLESLLKTLQDPRYKDRIVGFHFAGHAGSYELLFQDSDGAPTAVHAAGLAGLLGRQVALRFAFLNGCSTIGHVEQLLAHGVPCVIATSNAILDEEACDFASNMYRFLAKGDSLRAAFDQAAEAAKARGGGDYRAFLEPDSPDLDRWPWELYVAEGAETAASWSLVQACKDHTLGLPPLPNRDPPSRPFRYLEWFSREHAEFFFGRGREVRALFELTTVETSSPLILLYGQSGVGKSSLLAAGLLPRLESFHEVRYCRYDRDVGLIGGLLKALGEGDLDPPAAWHQVEGKCGRPLVLIFDQIEEAVASPEDPDQLANFARVLSQIFGDQASRPDGRIVLGFRKEWLPEIDATLEAEKLPRRRYFLQRLDRRGIVDAVEGVVALEARIKAGRQRTAPYNLSVDEGLPVTIADDMLADPDSPIAPTLQVLLSKMWDRAVRTSPSAPQFTSELYQDLRRKGLLLSDFLDEKINDLRTWRQEAYDSGLLLDFLRFHTSELGAAVSRSMDELREQYPHRQELLSELVGRCRGAYLLVELSGERGDDGVSRLAHDTLGPLVLERFQSSSLPGQRARRILEGRAALWEGGRTGRPLDSDDLAEVREGKAGMRAPSPDETRLLQTSAAEDSARKTRRWWMRVGAGAGGLAIVFLGVVSVMAGSRTATQEALNNALRQVAQAESRLDLGPDQLPEAVRLAKAAIDALARHEQYSKEADALVRYGLSKLATGSAPDQVPASDSGRNRLGRSGRYLAYLQGANAVQVRDLDGDYELPPLPLTESPSILSVEGSTAMIAAVIDGSRVQLWDPGARSLVIDARVPAPVSALALDTTNSLLLVSDQSGAGRGLPLPGAEPPSSLLRRVRRVLASDPSSPVVAMSLSADGTRLATVRGSGITVHDLRSGNQVARLSNEEESGGAPFTHVVLDQTGRVVLATSDRSRGSDLVVWDVATDVVLRKIPHAAPIAAIAVSSDGLLLGTAAGKVGTVWRIQDGEEVSRTIHTQLIVDLAFEAGDQRLVSVDRAGGIRRALINSTWPELVVEAESTIRRFDVNPSRTLVSGIVSPRRVGGRVRYARPSSAMVKVVPDLRFPEHLRFISDSTLAVGTDRGLWIADLTDADPPRLVREGRITALATRAGAVGSDLVRWAVGDRHGLLTLFRDGDTYQQVTVSFEREISDLEFTAEGSQLAVATADGIMLLNAQTALVDTLGGLPAKRLSSFGGPGKDLLAVVSDSMLTVWDVSARATIGTFPIGPVADILFLSDERFVASRGTDGAVSIWDWPRRALMTVLSGGPFTDLWLDPTDHTLALSDDRGRVRKFLWRQEDVWAALCPRLNGFDRDSQRNGECS